MIFDANQSHNELPPLPPGNELETRAVLKGCIAARSAIAALKEVGDLIHINTSHESGVSSPKSSKKHNRSSLSKLSRTVV